MEERREWSRSWILERLGPTSSLTQSIQEIDSRRQSREALIGLVGKVLERADTPDILASDENQNWSARVYINDSVLFLYVYLFSLFTIDLFQSLF